MSKARRLLNGLSWALFVTLWLLAAALAAADSAIGGIAVLVAGVIYLAVEIWIARKGESHETLVLAWRLIWRVGMAVIVVVVTVVEDDSTLGILVGVGAGCLIAFPALLIAAAVWLGSRRARRATRPEALD